MKTVTLASTAIRQLDYDEVHKTLVITFAGGGTDIVNNVSESTFEQFKNASSPGAWFNQNLRRPR